MYLQIKLIFGKVIPLLEMEDSTVLLSQKLSLMLSQYLSMTGINGSPIITLQKLPALNGRVMQVYVNDMLLPYSPETIQRSWLSQPSAQLRDLPYRNKYSFNVPDEWLGDYLTGLNLDDQQSTDQSLDFISRLVLSAILERPSVLVHNQQVLPFAGSLDSSVDVTFTSGIIKFLLDHGISLSESFLEIIKQGNELKRSMEDISEMLFSRLKSPVFEIIVSSEEFTNLTGGEPRHNTLSVYSEHVSRESREVMSSVEEGLFWDLGLQIPDLVWRISSEMPAGFVKFKLNDITLPSIPLLGNREIMVNVTQEHLSTFNIPKAYDTVNPANNKHYTVVPVDFKSLAEKEDLEILDPLTYVASLIEWEIKRHCTKLLTIDDVTLLLVKVRENLPVLTEKLLRRYSIENLTRILRAFLAERISIRDLVSIIERLMGYDTITIDSNKFIVFDDRFPITPFSSVLNPESWQSHYEFVRSGLNHLITSILLQGRSIIPVYQLDAKFEEWLIANNTHIQENSKDIETPCQNIRQAFWSEITFNNGYKPVILTTTEPRIALLKILKPELPDIIVASYSELTRDIRLQPVSRIYLPDSISFLPVPPPKGEKIVSL